MDVPIPSPLSLAPEPEPVPARREASGRGRPRGCASGGARGRCRAGPPMGAGPLAHGCHPSSPVLLAQQRLQLPAVVTARVARGPVDAAAVPGRASAPAPRPRTRRGAGPGAGARGSSGSPRWGGTADLAREYHLHRHDNEATTRLQSGWAHRSAASECRPARQAASHAGARCRPVADHEAAVAHPVQCGGHRRARLQPTSWPRSSCGMRNRG